MGACCSLDKTHDDCDSAASPSAQVVSIHGELRQYSLPVFVSQVLKSEQESSSPNSIFLCNSDSLCYDEYIPALDFDQQLQPNQIYFLLPLSKLQNPLSSKDMAALAVKASVAIKNAAKKESSRRNKARICPLLLVNSDDAAHIIKVEPEPAVKMINNKPGGPNPSGVLPRSGSVRKFHRYTSRRAKIAVRSFRLRLSTIYEEASLM